MAYVFKPIFEHQRGPEVEIEVLLWVAKRANLVPEPPVRRSGPSLNKRKRSALET